MWNVSIPTTFWNIGLHERKSVVIGVKKKKKSESRKRKKKRGGEGEVTRKDMNSVFAFSA